MYILLFCYDNCFLFGAIVLAFFVDTIFTTDIISSHEITEVSATHFKYLLFSQVHMLGFQLLSFLQLRFFLHSH